MGEGQNIPEDENHESPGVNEEIVQPSAPTSTEAPSPKESGQATINYQPSTTMEVHHHPEVEKKGFKEYLLEGLMIFVAVTMGFFAESIRENITDHTKEREFILSMIEDAKTDTANIRQAIILNTKRANRLDSLAALCFNYDAAQNNDSAVYRLYRFALIHPDFVSPAERTLLQLKNSGGMRLIKKKAAVDSVIQYDDIAKKLADQQAYYERYQNESINPASQIFNFKYFRFGLATGPKAPSNLFTGTKLLTQDKIKLIEFANKITIYHGVVAFYTIRLQEMNDHAVNLINSLQKEYHLENE
jgi:hypothetical protein